MQAIDITAANVATPWVAGIADLSLSFSVWKPTPAAGSRRLLADQSVDAIVRHLKLDQVDSILQRLQHHGHQVRAGSLAALLEVGTHLVEAYRIIDTSLTYLEAAFAGAGDSSQPVAGQGQHSDSARQLQALTDAQLQARIDEVVASFEPIVISTNAIEASLPVMAITLKSTDDLHDSTEEKHKDVIDGLQKVPSVYAVFPHQYCQT